MLAQRVLVVDDDATTRSLLEAILRRSSVEPVAVESVAAARLYLHADGSAAYDAVLTDLRMPSEDGLVLLDWVRDIDPTLSVVVMTASRDRELVAESLRGGAIGLVDKPLQPMTVLREMRAAVGRTRADRRRRDVVSAVGRVASLQRWALQSASVDRHITLRSYPSHEAAGDFAVRFPTQDYGEVLLLADVSGHDLGSAYTAAYFQGVLRGMHENGRSVEDMLHCMNAVLVAEWAQGDDTDVHTVGMSIAACAIAFDPSGHHVQITNAGGPAPVHVCADGCLTVLDRGRSMPLGWFADQLPATQHHDLTAGGVLLAWTDGLEELAARRELPREAVASALLLGGAAADAVMDDGVRDDVLVTQVALGAGWSDGDDTNTDDANDPWLPIFSVCVPASTSDRIDELLASSERAVRCVVTDVADSRMADILMAAREAVLNAMIHGGCRHPDLHVRVAASVRPHTRVLRVFVDDPGPGHAFDHRAHERAAGDALVDLHRGLVMIHRLSTTVQCDRHGASLRLDFRY